MSDLIIRSYRPDDIAAVTAIYGHYVRETVVTFETEAPDDAEMAGRFAAIAEKGHPLLIAEVDGSVAGYAYASTYRPRAAYRFTCEDSIYLDPGATGKGLGKLMLGELLLQSRAAGFRQMLAVITAGTDNSLRLHENFGFQQVGYFRDIGFKFDRWHDVVHLQKTL